MKRFRKHVGVLTGLSHALVIVMVSLAAGLCGQATTPKSTVPPNEEFSEVVKITVFDNGVRTNSAIDFQKRQTLTPPPEVQLLKDLKSGAAWMRTNGADAFADTAASIRGLIGLGLLAVPLDNKMWDVTHASDVLKEVEPFLSATRPTGPTFISARGDLPVTYFIRTRRGVVGVLQITGFTDNPEGVTLQYKIVNMTVSERPEPTPTIEEEEALVNGDAVWRIRVANGLQDPQAQALLKGLVKDGRQARLHPESGGTFEVIVGPIQSRARAETIKAELVTAGYKPLGVFSDKLKPGEVGQTKSHGRTDDDIIIETRAEGMNSDRYEEVAGKFIDSNKPITLAKSYAPGLTPADKMGSRKALITGPNSTNRIQTETAVARFLPKFKAPGHYHVYITWSASGNAEPVNCTVKHAKGEEKKSLSQNGWGVGAPSNANRWQPLGDYDFEAGDDQYVEIGVGKEALPVKPDIWGQMNADAVRFTKEPLSEQQIAPESTPEIVPPAMTAPVAPASPFVDATPATAAALGAPKPSGAVASAAVSTPGATAAPTAAVAPEVKDVPTTAPPLKVFDNFLDALTEADSAGKKRIMIFFYSPASDASEHYEKALGTAAVRDVVDDKYIVVKINFAEMTELAEKFRVVKDGTIVVFDASGVMLGQITTRLSASELATKLKSF